jgi:hypothetical protein
MNGTLFCIRNSVGPIFASRLKLMSSQYQFIVVGVVGLYLNQETATCPS